MPSAWSTRRFGAPATMALATWRSSSKRHKTTTFKKPTVANAAAGFFVGPSKAAVLAVMLITNYEYKQKKNTYAIRRRNAFRRDPGGEPISRALGNALRTIAEATIKGLVKPEH